LVTLGANEVDEWFQVHALSELEETVEADSSTGWNLNRIGAGQTGRSGAGVTIFIFDTGIRSTHEQFGGRASGALDMTRGQMIECEEGDAECAADNVGHGTFQAGIAVGRDVGVAPQASVRGIKVLSDQGSGAWAWSIGALDWLAASRERPAVASLTIGGRNNAEMTKAIDRAVNAGVVVVAGAGQSFSDACRFSPGSAASAITVGGTDQTDSVMSYSNHGSCIDIWAPGEMISSTDGTKTGTGFAVPHVAGAAGLILQADPSMKPQSVKKKLQEDAAKNYIHGCPHNNLLLNVADGGSPPPGSVSPCPNR